MIFKHNIIQKQLHNVTLTSRNVKIWNFWSALLLFIQWICLIYCWLVLVLYLIQVLSNANYKSVEHRVIVNSAMERVSLAFFYNPKSDIPIKPVEELVSADNPALYSPMTFDEYRLFIRLRGPKGKSQVESLKSPRWLRLYSHSL